MSGGAQSLNYSPRSDDERRENPKKVLFNDLVDASNSKQSHIRESRLSRSTLIESAVALVDN